MENESSTDLSVRETPFSDVSDENGGSGRAGFHEGFWFRITVCAAAAWALLFSSYSIWLFLNCRASIDSAIHAQLLESVSNGGFFGSSLIPEPFPGRHFWPGMYLFVPVWRAFGLPGMYVAQAVLVACGVIPVFNICFDVTRKADRSFLLAMAYLFCPTVASGVLFDFHFELISVPASLLALSDLQKGRWRSVVPLLVALSLYEVNCFVWPFVGLAFAFGGGRGRRIGFATLGISLVYGLVVMGIVMPSFRTASLPHVWERYSDLGPTPALALKAVLARPAAFLGTAFDHHDVASLRLLLAFGLLPVLGLKHLLPAIPLWLMLLAGNSELSSNIRFGYFAPLVPVLVLSSAHGIAFLDRVGSKIPSALLARGLLVCGTVWSLFYYSVAKPMKRHPLRIRENLPHIRAAVSAIPPGASVSADWHLLPAVGARDSMAATPATSLSDGVRCDWMLVDLSEKDGKGSGWSRSVRSSVLREGYAPVFFAGDIALLERGAPANELSGKFVERLNEKERTGALP